MSEHEQAWAIVEQEMQHCSCSTEAFDALRKLRESDADHEPTLEDHVRAIRRGLIALGEAGAKPIRSLEVVLDAWDEHEHAAGTAEGGEHEVIS